VEFGYFHQFINVIELVFAIPSYNSIHTNIKRLPSTITDIDRDLDIDDYYVSNSFVFANKPHQFIKKFWAHILFKSRT
jgi:hypothetical protein